MRDLNYMVPLLPPGWKPRVGLRVRWPGEDCDWVWDGERWHSQSWDFDGGDSWLDPDEEAA